MKIGVLTSSRADFGIYLPLLRKMKKDTEFELTIIAFGTHGSSFHGETITEIETEGFKQIDLIHSLLINDSANGIATAYGVTVMKFADYWATHHYDVVLCLGDRFEMSAAVQAGIPFGVRFAHIHGGETTLGVIDNIYRHQITLASMIHFPSTKIYAKRIKEVTGKDEQVFQVGSLSLDGIEEFQFMDERSFRDKFGIPDRPYVLVTLHPETVRFQKNREYAIEMKKALMDLIKSNFLVITMPNADTQGTIFRNAIDELIDQIAENILCIENFGKFYYFNAMKYSRFLLGNTSSGIIEAASFGKYVVNVGERQEGRVRSGNVLDCAFQSREIVETANKAASLGVYKGTNIFKQSNSADKIIKVLKKTHATL